MINLILGNTFLEITEHFITTFVTCGAFVGINLFILQKLLQLL